MAEVKYEITEKLGVLGETGNGWTKELNLVSWSEREPVYDVPGTRHMTVWAKGSPFLWTKSNR